jgi:eukaryotic-like serine/threonine-protein kinase
VFDCPHCEHENFFDAQQIDAYTCWNCRKSIPAPVRINIGRQVIALNPDTQLYPHHVDSRRLYDFSRPVAAVMYDPNGNRWGLRNLSSTPWKITAADGSNAELPNGRTLVLKAGYKINFGSAEGEIRL